MHFEQSANALADFGPIFDKFNEVTVSSNSSQSGETELESLTSPGNIFCVKGNTADIANKFQDLAIGHFQPTTFFDLATAADDSRNNHSFLYQELEPLSSSGSKLGAAFLREPFTISPPSSVSGGDNAHASTSSFPELNNTRPPPASATMDPKLQEKLHFQMLLQQKMMQQEQQMMNSHNIGAGLSSEMANNNHPGRINLSAPAQPPSYAAPSPSHAHYASYKLPSPGSVTRSLPQVPSITRGGVNFHMHDTAARHHPTQLSAHFSTAPHVYHRAGSVGSTGSRPLVTSELPAYGMQQQRHAQPMRSYQQQSHQQQLPVTSSQGFQAPQHSMNGTIYQIQFKCSVRYFTLSAQISVSVSRGDFVVVEADRGEDIGVVTEVLSMKSFVERRIMSNAYVVDDEESVVGRIIRLATLAERQTLSEKFRNEETVLQVCRDLAYSTYRLPMSIHNVEYQFDRHKLTIHYSADSRVDFREFVRELFSAYKARIWMKKVEPHKPVSFDASAAMALATGMQFSC